MNFKITDIERVHVQINRGTDYIIFFLTHARTKKLLGARAEHWPEMTFSMNTPNGAALDVLKDMGFQGPIEILDHQTSKVIKMYL